MTKTLSRPVGLFVPCYIDQLYPDVGLATVEVLRRFGVEVVYPEAQTCCGQPMVNAGCADAARPLARRFIDIFTDFEHVVCPSASCVSMVRNHYEDLVPDGGTEKAVRGRTFELVEFLTDVLGIQAIEGSFPHRVGLHQSCHGLRELRLGAASELVPLRRPADAAPDPAAENRALRLLASLQGISFATLDRSDECCGFGGTFAVSEDAVSCMMGEDRIADHERAGTEILTAGDMSCLMHLEGLLRRQGKPMRVMHIAQILAGRSPAAP